MANRAPLIAPEIVDAAVSWAVRIEFGEPDASTRQAFEDWIRADSRHQEAWRRVASLGDDMPQVPAALATATLQRRQRLQAGRRNALKLLGTTGALVLAAWSAPQTPVWQRRFADQATNVGQRQRLALAGTARLDLNTDTAVDLPFGPQGNTLRLRRGEIRVDNRAEGAAAIAIQTPLGWLQSSAAALVLRLQQGMLRIDLLAGQAQLQGNQGRVTLTPGQPLLVSADDSVALPPPRFTVDGWIDGVLSVHDMPLGEVVDELARYTRRWLRCDPALVQRRISGILHIDQIDDALAHLAASQGLQLQRRFGVWTLTEKN